MGRGVINTIAVLYVLHSLASQNRSITLTPLLLDMQQDEKGVKGSRCGGGRGGGELICCCWRERLTEEEEERRRRQKSISV